jgi:uncharacterized protein (TIGR00290 family)
MRLGVLFSGGKDSTLALHMASETDVVACLITVVSHNKESYMFHTPNVDVTALQAEALGLPMVRVETEGQKEAELANLEDAIRQAKSQHGIEGVVTGAVESVYQASRVQRICNVLDLWCLIRCGSMTRKRSLKPCLQDSSKLSSQAFSLTRSMRSGLASSLASDD